MATPTKSLNAQVKWTSLLPAIGVDAFRNSIIPQTVHCPVCGEDQLYICEDRVLGGQWASCQSCLFAGDLVELAAATWQVEVPGAVARLGHTGLFPQIPTIKVVDDYVANHVMYRRRLTDFWERASRKPMELASTSTRHLLRQFGLLDQAQSPAWPDEAGRFIGAANRQEVESLFSPLSHEQQERVNPNGKTTRRRGGGPGKRRLFRGRDWEDVLVLPYFDVPGRICGFLFIGRDADPDAGDYVFRRGNLGPGTRTIREAGFGMLAALGDGPHPQLGDSVFVVSDPVIGILLKAQGLREGLHPLPIVLSHFSPEIQTLNLPDQLASQKLIFWNDHSGLRLAKRCDGSVSKFKISRSEIERRLNHRTPLDWLRLVKKHSTHWSIALREELRTLAPRQAGELLLQLEFTPTEIRNFTIGCDPELRERLEQCDPHRITRRRVLVSGVSVVETETGWEIETTGEKLCNLPIRIEELLTTDGGEAFYRGIVPTSNAVTHITIPASEVKRRGLFQCVHDRLIEQEAGVLNFQPKWNKRSAFIALELNPPTLVTGSSRIGWNPQRRCFMFPKFTISCRGVVDSDVLPLAVDGNEPGRHLERPSRLSRLAVDLLSSATTEVAIAWAMLACIVHNVLAGFMGNRSCGVILDGASAQSTGPAVARVLGCAELNLRQRRPTLTMLERINDGCTRHAWPTVVRLADGPTKVTADWIDSPGPRNAILSLDRHTALAVGSHPGFFTIRAFEPPVALGDLQKALVQLVPAYIQDVCARRLWIEQGAEHEVFNVLADIRGWFDRQGGDGAAVESARTVLSVDGLAPCNSFMDLAFHLRQQGQITYAVARWELPDEAPSALVCHSGKNDRPTLMWLCGKAFNRVLARMNAPAMNLAAVEQSFKDAQVWFANEMYRDEEGILIDDAWYVCQERQWLARHGFAEDGRMSRDSGRIETRALCLLQ